MRVEKQVDRFVASASAAVILTVLGAGPALAQASQQGPQVASASTHLQELVVTAERRRTNLQVTPVAATVLTSEKLENQRIVNFADLAINVPNMTYTQFSTQESYFSIRGTLINKIGRASCGK